MNRYLILAVRRPLFDPADVPRHLAYLDELRKQGQVELAGPFGDQSGGAYLLRAADLAQATAIAHNDPAHLSGGWQLTVREWRAK